MKKRLENTYLFAILALAWPTMVEQALQTFVQYVDSAMVGKLGADASAAVGISTTLNWLINNVFLGLGIGFLAVIARSIGAKKMEKVKITAAQSIYIAGILGVIMTIITLSVSSWIPVWLGAAVEIRKTASVYFFLICTPMIFRSCSLIFGSVLRGTGDMKTPMLVNLLVNGMNVVLNFLFIYPTRNITVQAMTIPIYGAGLGVAGAALATAISLAVGGILMTVALLRNPIASPLGEAMRWDGETMKQCIKIGFPIQMERTAVCLGHVAFTAIVTSLGTISLAAHTIALTAEEAFYIPGFGLQASASTLAGNALGEGNPKKLRRLSFELIALTMAILTVTGCLLFFFATPMMQLFTGNTEVIEQGTAVLKIVALSEPIFGVAIILEGVFNGIGDTKVNFWISLISMWVIRILSASICLNVFHMGLRAVWVCMVCDNVFRASVLLYRFIWKKSKILRSIDN